MQVSRQKFQEAIEFGIKRASVPDKPAAALREVGRTATECTVGDYANCPLTQAGYGLGGDYFIKRVRFATGFDSQFLGVFDLEITDEEV